MCWCRFAVGRTSEQLKVLRSIGIRPAGLVIANSCSLKQVTPQGWGGGFRSPRLVNNNCVCPQNLSVSTVLVSQQTQETVVTVKLIFVVLLQGLVHIQCPGNSQGPTLRGMGWGASPGAVLRFGMGSKSQHSAKSYLHVVFKKPAPQCPEQTPVTSVT